MKFTKTFLFAVASVLIFISCSKGEEAQAQQYYIKYEVESGSLYYHDPYTIEYAGLDGMVTIKTIAGPWEVTVGPVNKGFHATLNASFDDAGKYGMLYLYNKASISVSKADEPFVQKAYDEEAHPIKLHCIVGD